MRLKFCRQIDVVVQGEDYEIVFVDVKFPGDEWLDAFVLLIGGDAWVYRLFQATDSSEVHRFLVESFLDSHKGSLVFEVERPTHAALLALNPQEVEAIESEILRLSGEFERATFYEEDYEWEVDLPALVDISAKSAEVDKC